MANSAELKVKATMDNADLKKKAKESKDALKDFAKVGEDAVSSLGSAFGVNTGKIEQMMSAVRGLGESLSKSGNTGAVAIGNLLKGVNGLSAGIAGLGIGAAVAGFKLLKEETENFKQTVSGANIEMQTAAYINTYRQVIHDFNREVGEGAANAQSSWQKFWGTIGTGMKAAFQTGAFAAASQPGFINNDSLVTYNNLLSEAGDKARTAEDISKNIFQIQRQISDSSVEWARWEREIAEYKRIAYDKTLDTKTQQEALAKATELINKRYGEEADLRKQLADLQVEFNNLAESSVADIDKANQLRIQEENTVARMNNALRELSERQATIAANAQKEAQARKEAAEYAAKIAQSRVDLKTWTDNSAVSPLEGKAEEENPEGIAVPVTPVLDTSAVMDLSNELQSILASSFESLGSSIGTLISDLVTGEDAWSNFANSAVSSLGDMAISVGKLAIQLGTAMLAIKAALNFGGPWAAIAAGVALVALGAAIKSSMSNIASGNYSAGGSVATSTGSYGGSSTGVGTSFDTRDITVNVKGSLRADGNQLLAVIENENTRRNHTT